MPDQLRCNVCGVFMGMQWATDHDWFADEQAAYCHRHAVPAKHEDRQEWLRQHATKVDQYIQWKFRCSSCHCYVKQPRCEYVNGEIVNERGFCGRCAAEVVLEPMTEEDWFPWLLGMS